MRNNFLKNRYTYHKTVPEETGYMEEE